MDKEPAKYVISTNDPAVPQATTGKVNPISINLTL
jgi:hypothetical protein